MKRKLADAEDHVTPHSEEAEDGICSAILQSPSLIPFIRSKLDPESFFCPTSKMLYGVLLEMDLRKHPIDLVTVDCKLRSAGLRDQIGDGGRLAELYSYAPIQCQWEEYIVIINEKHLLRTVMAGCDGLKNDCLMLQDDSGIFTRAAQKRLSEMEVAIRPPDPEKTWGDTINDVRSEWENIRTGKSPSAMPMPWRSWNDVLGGLVKGYVAFMGLKKTGKSSLAGHCAVHAALELDEVALIVTYETRVNDIIRRAACNISGVDGDFIFHPDRCEPSQQEARAFAKALDRIEKSKLRVIRGAGMNVHDIAHQCRLMKPRVCVVDYLLRLPALPEANPKEGTEGATRANSKALFNLSEEMDGTLIVINHTVATGDRKGEGRWGDALSNDVDLSLVIQEDGILVKERRNGKAGDILPIFFNGSTYSFREKHQ